MADNKNFGEWMVSARKARGLSQEALAEAAGVTQEYISGLERGVRNPSKKMVLSAAKALTPTDADEHTSQVLVNTGLRAAGFASNNEIKYIVNPDTARIAEAYDNAPQRIQKAVDALLAPDEEYSEEYTRPNPSGRKSAAELAFEMERESSIGKRAE